MIRDASASNSGFVFGYFPNAKNNVAYEFGMRSICSSTGAPVAITKVTATGTSGGLHVVDWGTRYVTPTSNVGTNFDGLARPIISITGFGHFPIRAKCSAIDANQFDVNFAANTVRGAMTGVNVYFGPGLHITLQYALVLCANTKCADVPHP